MIDLYNLELEIGYGADVDQIEISRGETIELITRLRQTEKDAARYRYMRDSGKFLETGVKFDKVVDLAMQSSGGDK